MKKFNSKSLIALIFIIISVVWMYLGITEYGLWDPKNGPMSGFFPTIVGGVLLLSSIVYFIKSFSMAPAKYDRPAIYLMIALVAIFFVSMLIGFLPTLLIFYIFWLRVMEKMPGQDHRNLHGGGQRHRLRHLLRVAGCPLPRGTPV